MRACAVCTCGISLCPALPLIMRRIARQASVPSTTICVCVCMYIRTSLPEEAGTRTSRFVLSLRYLPSCSSLSLSLSLVQSNGDLVCSRSRRSRSRSRSGSNSQSVSQSVTISKELSFYLQRNSRTDREEEQDVLYTYDPTTFFYSKREREREFTHFLRSS